MKYEVKNTTKNQNLITNLFLGLAGFVLLLAASQPVKAQFSASIYSTIQTTNQNLWNDMNRYNQIYKQGEKLASESSNSTTNTSNIGTVFQSPARQYPITTTDFTPSSVRLMPDQFVNSTPNLTPEQKENLRVLFYKFLTNYEKQARKNNLANSFAFVVGISLEIVNQKEVSGKEYALMISYYNNTLGNFPQFRNYTDQQKQTLYESSIITGGVMSLLYLQKDPAMQLQARELAKMILKSLAGINLA